MKPRLREVAELAQVSQATVSRVINGRPGVSETTRRQVLNVLSRFGFEPASGINGKRRRLVGLLVPELDNPAFPRFAQALESRLAGDGWTTVLCTFTPTGMDEAEYIDVLLDHSVSGVVIVCGDAAKLNGDHGRYDDLIARQVPTVFVNGRAPSIPLPSVTVDHEAAARQAVAHLVTLGHTRIGLAAGPRRFLPSAQFIKGYAAGLEIAGLPDEGLTTETLYGIEGGHAAGLKLIERGASGIVCASDQIALGAIRAVREAGLSVQDDVSIIGFDDAGPNAFFDPPLTSCRQPFDAMAAAVVRLLSDVEEEERKQVTGEFRFQPELVVRSSTGRAPDPAMIASRDARVPA